MAALMLPGVSAMADEAVFLSTQLRPIEAAQAMRSSILNGFPGGVAFVTEQPPQLGVHVRAEQQAGKPVTSLIGGLHGELLPLAGSLQPLDELAARLQDRHLNAAMLASGKLGGEHQLYIPWMQATYLMAANKQGAALFAGGGGYQCAQL